MEFATQCSVTVTSRILGGRWSAKIVWSLLRHEKLRFSELRRACPSISDRMLSKELKALEGWGLVAKYDYATIPPRTEYSLTDRGKTLRPVMEAMANWGSQTREFLTKAAE